jgi:branched-chain amino acid transport system ATP-binding protein
MRLLEINNVSVSYGAAPALLDISIALEDGGITVLLGPNGAGKSTLIKSIMGLIHINKGEIYYQGKRIDGLTVNQIARRGVAIVPEGREVFADMSVIENLYLGGYRRTKKQIEAELANTIDIYFPRLRERRHQMAGTLSGGEQQMLAIARAVMSGAEMMLLDEPSLGLSPVMVTEVRDIILKINKEKKVSIMMVEQNARLGIKLASYVYLLEGGRIRLEGTCEEISKSEQIIKAYIGTSRVRNDDMAKTV